MDTGWDQQDSRSGPKKQPFPRDWDIPGMGPQVAGDPHPQGCPVSPGYGPTEPAVAVALAMLGAGLGWRSPLWCLQLESFYTSVITHENSNISGFLFFSSMLILHSLSL